MVNDFLVANGVAVRVNDAGREHGQIRAFNYSGYDATKTIPTVVLRNEDYGRIARILADGTPVTLELQHRQSSIIPKARRPTTRSPRSTAATRKTKSSCSAAISIRGTRPPARPTTRSAAR